MNESIYWTELLHGLSCCRQGNAYQQRPQKRINPDRTNYERGLFAEKSLESLKSLNSLESPEGQSNLEDAAEWPKPGLLNQAFGSIMWVFLGQAAESQSSLNLLQSDPQNSLNLIHSPCAPADARR